ncbi:MAG: beta-N-acetylhexosaminidase [Deltaproteobacteria bacterium]|nr:beta-N-acetylhexosaminidase [Deltaproteobacteria bacterium]
MNDIGQLLMIGIEGTKVSDDLKSFIKESNVGGVILFKRNCAKLRQIFDLINELQDISDTPLIVGLDEEGGRVSRLPEQFTKYPAMRDVGRVDTDGSIAHKIGETLGRELRTVGFNINFAPVLDVSTDAFNPVIGDRAFASDPAVVSKLALEFIRGMESMGVGGCGKHFPGHGDTDVDSHKGLPVLNHTRRRFDTCEFIPFREVAKAGVSSMMIAHLMAPNLDPNEPSSISRKIVDGILRKEMGYDGLIFSDDLTMKGLADLHAPSESAWMTINAGCDIAMVCSENLELHRSVMESLKRASDDGNLLQDRIAETLKRIDSFKKMFCSHRNPLPLDIAK